MTQLLDKQKGKRASFKDIQIKHTAPSTALSQRHSHGSLCYIHSIGSIANRN